MKKFMKIGALSLALVASLLMISNNKTHAAVVGSVSFSITGTANATCQYGTAWSTATPLSYSSSIQNADSTLTSFICTDTLGAYTWSMTLAASSAVSNGLTSIVASWVSMQASTHWFVNGPCTLGTNTTTYTAISPTAGTIMSKAAPANGTCTVTTATVGLRVAVPAYATPGSYSGTLTLTLPW